MTIDVEPEGGRRDGSPPNTAGATVRTSDLAGRTAALVTSSYRGDFERCRLLCESVDRYVTGATRHLILVEPGDLDLFGSLAGPRREIVDERDLLPAMIRPVPDPMSLGRRRLWLSPYGLPLHGWHIQQLRRLSVARSVREPAIISLDSDVVFLRPFDVADFWKDGRVRFFRRPGAVAGLAEPYRSEHRKWAQTASTMLGIETSATNDNGYVATLIAWRTDTMNDLKRRIETLHDRPWLKVLCSTRHLSECTLYGRFVDEVEGRPDRHFTDEANPCAMYWSGDAMDEASLRRFVDGLEPHQVAAGIQSFTGTEPDLIRRVAGLD